ncbi:MAG: aminotransferase class V-fold PLP-dependent enzyme [Planctomycetes bacterium]|nr:aminotransferase class V-fold PLP-dependent enzyme [Planctomycetota bacterium]
MSSRSLGVSQARPQPLDENLISHWLLDRSIAFLNHGSYGATPKVVLETQTAWRTRIEARPVEQLERRRDEMLGGAKQAVAQFINAEPKDFGFVTNATGGVNAVLRSLQFGRGDELVTTSHVYNAIRQAMRHAADRSGATVVEVKIPLPIASPDVVVGAVTAALTGRTRLVVIDHITSPTAILFPVETILAACAARGIDVLVDGAHAPGMVDLNVGQLNASYYTANLHKWVCAPKGSAFLWVRPDKQGGIHPNTISHFLGEGLAKEFGWQGTRDITAWLCAKDAIDFMGGFGWDQVRRHNHELATWVQALLSRQWGVEPSTPLDGSMLGSMVTVGLPDGARRHESTAALQAKLFDRFHIEVPIIEWDDRWWVRASCQVYNTADQYERLGDAVVELTR